MEPVAVVLDPEHNPDRFTVRIGKTMEWDTIANQIVDLQVSVRPALRATEHRSRRLLAENFQFYESGRVFGVFVTSWSREGNKFVVHSALIK
jgi:hypothetical protein